MAGDSHAYTYGSFIGVSAASRGHIGHCRHAAPETTKGCRLLVRYIDVVNDLLDTRDLTDRRFGIPFCQTSIDHAIEVHDIGQRLHSDRSGRP